MKKLILGGLALLLLGAVAALSYVRVKTGMGPLTLYKVSQGGFQTDPAVLQRLATGGQPMGRWKEGLMFDGVSPQPWLKSAANWFPGTEAVQPEEIRVTFMGSSPLPRPG
jgi:ribonuclease Z